MNRRKYRLIAVAVMAVLASTVRAGSLVWPFCIEIYRPDVLQHWVVHNSSRLCSIEEPSSEEFKMGLQAVRGTLYLSMNSSNQTIQSYWITERYMTEGSLSVSIFDPEQKAPSFFTFEKTTDEGRRGTFSFRWDGKESSIKRSIFFIGDKDIYIIGGENNFKIILISTNVLVLSMMIVNFLMNALDFTTIFITTFFLSSCVLQGEGGMAYATALVTAIGMTAIFCSIVSFINYRLGWKATGPVLTLIMIGFLSLTTGSAFHFWNLFFTIVLCGIMIYFKVGTCKLDQENEKMVSKAYLSVQSFYLAALWIITTSFFYFPSELYLRITREYKDLARNELSDTMAMCLYIPLVAISIIALATSHMSILKGKINESELAIKEGSYVEASLRTYDAGED